MLHLIRITKHKILEFVKSTDLVLLVFLLLVLNVSLAIKLIALLFIYTCRFNFKLDLKNKRLPLFYIFMIGLIFIQLIFNYQHLQLNYLVLCFLCMGFWGTYTLILHQLKLAIEKKGPAMVDKAITLFFIINCLVSIFNVISILLEIKTNPYTFEGLNLKYHVSTGDWIRGVLFDFSLTNSLISIFGLIYFLYKEKIFLSVLCLTVVVLATSNASIILLIAALLLILAFHKNRVFKHLAVCFIGLIVVFFVKVTPQNIEYTLKTAGSISKKDSEPNQQKLNEQQENSKHDILRNYSSIIQKNNTQAPIKKSETDKDNNIKIVESNIKDIEKKHNQQIDSNFIKSQKTAHETLITSTKKIYQDSVSNVGAYALKKYPGKFHPAH